MKYDPEIIHQHAKGLYDQASATITNYVVSWVLLGAAIGYGMSAVFGSFPNSDYVLAGFCGLMGSYPGYTMGKAKAISLKLEAQLALLQLQIEVNSRKPATN